MHRHSARIKPSVYQIPKTPASNRTCASCSHNFAHTVHAHHIYRLTRQYEWERSLLGVWCTKHLTPTCRRMAWYGVVDFERRSRRTAVQRTNQRLSQQIHRNKLVYGSLAMYSFALHCDALQPIHETKELSGNSRTTINPNQICVRGQRHLRIAFENISTAMDVKLRRDCVLCERDTLG